MVMGVKTDDKELMKEMEITCVCGRKIKIKFLSPVVVEQECNYETRRENSIL